jgi:hypothetical protein
MSIFDSILDSIYDMSSLGSPSEKKTMMPPPIPPQSKPQGPPPVPPVTPVPKPAYPDPATQETESEESEGIYSAKLEKLISFALVDGKISDKERQVLYKNARAEGIDIDEFEMVLEARLYEINKAATPQPPPIKLPPTPAPAPATAPAPQKSNKYGEVKKCPACGAIVESYTTQCAACGLEYRNDQPNPSIQQLFYLLMQVEDQKGTLDIFTYNSLYKKVQIIKNFPIPISKENIIEFLVQALPLTKCGKFWEMQPGDREIANAWKAKCEQVILKAKFALKDDDPELYAEIEKYAKELKIKL